MATKASKEQQSSEEAEAAETKANAKTKRSKKPAKKASTRKSREKATKGVRLKAFWGVFNQSLNAVALFEHSERKEADKKAEELSESKKSPHFVQLVKKVIEE